MNEQGPTVEERLDAVEQAVCGVLEAVSQVAEAVAALQKKRTAEGGMRAFRERIAARAAGRTE